MAVSNYQLFAVFAARYPATSRALQKLVMAMAKAAKSFGKRSIFGKNKEKAARDDVWIELQRCYLAMQLDGVIERAEDNLGNRTKLRELIDVFESCFPNWQKAYAYWKWFASADDNLYGLLSAEFGNQSKIIELMKSTHNVLNGIVEVENRMLAGGITSILKAIDFASSKQELTSWASQLVELQSRMASVRSLHSLDGPARHLADLLDSYLEKLLTSTRLLVHLSDRLGAKASGNAYRYAEHQDDLRKFRLAQSSYTAAGSQINRAIGRVRSGLTT